LTAVYHQISMIFHKVVLRRRMPSEMVNLDPLNKTELACSGRGRLPESRIAHLYKKAQDYADLSHAVVG